MILSVLKIIGIVFLVILIILIFILGILLFIPIRYRFQGSYYAELDGMVCVRWTPLLLKVEAVFRNGRPEYTVKLFGGVVMTNTDVRISWLGRKFFSSEEEETEERKQGTKKHTLEEPALNENAEDIGNKRENEVFTECSKNIEKEETEHFQPAIEKDIKKRQPFLKKLRERILGWKRKWVLFKRKSKDVKHKKDALLNVYHSKRFEAAKQDIKLYIKEIFRILKPDQLEGYVHFGMEDPAITGQILGGMAVFLPLYQGFLDVLPDFEKKCLDGNLKGKGKIFLFPIVKLILKVILNKNLIKVTKKVQTIIEA